MYAYCIQCLAAKSETVAKRLDGIVAERAFSPKILQRQRKLGKLIDEYGDMLPGYVFIFNSEKLEGISDLRRMDGVIRCLNYKSENGSVNELSGADYEFAMNLYKSNGRIGEITVFKQGDSVKIDDELFRAYEGVIENIDIRKQRAKIKYVFDGQIRYIWVACSVLFKA